MRVFAIHPEMDQESEPYWLSVKEHRAKLQQCAKCTRFRFPPSPNCYFCGTEGGKWVPISGRGTIYSWIVIHHPIDKRLIEEVPFVVALVELEEGVRIAGRLIGVNREQIKAGMAVKVRYDDVDGDLTLLNFEDDGKMDG